MGFLHTRLLDRLGFLDSIVEPNRETAEKVVKKFNVSLYNSVEELAKERRPNGVIVAVPTSIHAKVALEVAAHLPTMKCLLIEKPVATSVNAALELKKKLKTSDVKILHQSELLEVLGIDEVEKVKINDLDEQEQYELFVDTVIILEE